MPAYMAACWALPPALEVCVCVYRENACGSNSIYARAGFLYSCVRVKHYPSIHARVCVLSPAVDPSGPVRAVVA